MRVLVVDDSADLVLAVSLLLQHAGHECVRVTENFSDLLHPGTWVGIDGAVIDLNLHARGIDGAMIAEYGAQVRPSARLVLLTGSERGNGETFAKAAKWASAVLRKPASGELIIAALEGPSHE